MPSRILRISRSLSPPCFLPHIGVVTAAQLFCCVIKLEGIIGVQHFDIVVYRKKMQHVLVALLARLVSGRIHVSKLRTHVLYHMGYGLALKPIVLRISRDNVINCDVVSESFAVNSR